MQNEILKIHVLGPVEIASGRETIKINRRIERAILYILAVEHRPVSRTTMIDLLWPNADQIDPRAALRTALSRLKRTLPAPEIIKTELDTLQINLNYCEVDLVKFENHVQSLQNLLNGYPQPEPLPKQIVNQLQEALTLWRGDNLLHGENLSAYPEIEIWLRTHDQQYSSNASS
jgi:two-component SAPR family response regulator